MFRAILASGLAMTLAACATFAPPARTGPDPVAGTIAWAPDSPRVALVLSGGAARGFAHIGVLRVLEANGLRPDLVVGSSAGALVGALYASGRSAAEVDEGIAELHLANFNDLVFPGLGFLPGEKGLVRGEKLQRYIADRVRVATIEDFPIRFAAVATDLSWGEPVAFTAGDAALAVRASMAAPGIVVPAVIAGKMYGDGQIASPVPVDIARKLGARVVIAVDVVYPPEDALISSAWGALFQAFAISVHRIRKFELAGADVIVVPRLPQTSGQFTLADRDRLIAAGEEGARAALPMIRAQLQARQTSNR